jgi:hypothetical protein
VEYNNGPGPACPYGISKTSLFLEMLIVIYGKYIPHDDLKIRKALDLIHRNSAIWRAEDLRAVWQQVVASLHIRNVLTKTGLPSIKMVECVVANCMTIGDDSLENSGMFLNVITDAKECSVNVAPA